MSRLRLRKIPEFKKKLAIILLQNSTHNNNIIQTDPTHLITHTHTQYARKYDHISTGN